MTIHQRARAALLALGCVLSGCDQPEEPSVNHCTRREVFIACMDRIPRGPERLAASGNDIAEAIDECETAAYYQSMQRADQIPMECR